MSLGNINDEANERYSKAFFQFFKDKLGVAGNRGYMYVFFCSISPCVPHILSSFVDPSMTRVTRTWGELMRDIDETHT